MSETQTNNNTEREKMIIAEYKNIDDGIKSIVHQNAHNEFSVILADTDCGLNFDTIVFFNTLEKATEYARKIVN